MKRFALPTQALPTLCDSREANIKRFLWLTPTVFVLMLGTAFADRVSINFVPNDGSGDNFFFQQTGALTFAVGGGVPYDFFNIGPYLPGTEMGGGTDIFGGASVQIDGIWYVIGSDSMPALFMSPFTLPTNGKDFIAH